MPDSDYDLLIIMPSGARCRKNAFILYQNISGIKTPYDLIVTTEDSINKYAGDPGLIYSKALGEGKEIYAA